MDLGCKCIELGSFIVLSALNASTDTTPSVEPRVMACRPLRYPSTVCFYNNRAIFDFDCGFNYELLVSSLLDLIGDDTVLKRRTLAYTSRLNYKGAQNTNNS